MNRFFLKALVILASVMLQSLLNQGYVAADAASGHSVIINANIYSSSAATDYGFYRIDSQTSNRHLISIPDGQGMSNVRFSPDGNYALGKKFNREKFTHSLFLIDLIKEKSYRLTCYPNDEEKSVTTWSTFGEYGFSPDSRFAVITFPNDFELMKSYPIPFLLSDKKNESSKVALLDLSEWGESKKKNSLIEIEAIGYPVFSKSGKRFVVPVSNGVDYGMKLMIYETEKGKSDDSSAFFGYELPFSKVYQVSFASESKLFILDGDDLILYNLIGSRVEKREDMKKFSLFSTALNPPHFPEPSGLSNGAIAFSERRFSFLTSEFAYPLSRISLEDLSDDTNSLKYDKGLLLIYGDAESSALRWTRVPPLPAEVYDKNRIYHNLYPIGSHRIVILVSTGWSYQAFRIINLDDGKISNPIPGFVMGISRDEKALLYFQCGNDNCCRYRGTDFSWEDFIFNGKKIGIKANRVYYLDVKTFESKRLIAEPGHTGSAFIF